MQNQNIHPWTWAQEPAPPFTGPRTILPTTFPPTGVDQHSLLPGYSIYGGSPSQTPPDYTQWTSAQMQQWQQWQQWQEKYQEWQAQYGKKYAETLAAIGQNSGILMPGIPPVMGVPKPVKPDSMVPSVPNPPLPTNSQPVPPPPPEEEKPPVTTSSAEKESTDGLKNGCDEVKEDQEELSEAEKTFDIQFKQWEDQFNNWKKENQDHPDKVQYREYEKKWEAWRGQLLHRREQMRRKRLGLPFDLSVDGNAAGKADDAKGKTTGNVVSQPKSADVEYNYRTQPPPNHFANNSSNPDKQPTANRNTPQQNVPQQNNTDNGSNVPSSHQTNLPSKNSGGFSDNQDKIDNKKLPQCGNNRNQGFMNKQGFPANPGGNNNQGKGPNFRFGNAEAGTNEGNGKFRSPNQDAGPRFGGGRFDNSRGFGNEDKNCEPPSNFSFDGPKNEKDSNQQQFDNFKDKDAGSSGFGQGDNITVKSGEDFQNTAAEVNPSKPKVPSLFDITVEKPPCLMDSKPNIWEKDNFDAQKELEQQKNDRSWNNNNNSRMRNSPSPWLQPWEIEKFSSQKSQEAKPWDKGGPRDNAPWMTDVSNKQEIDKAELSGYVGNILAKLGNFNVVPGVTKNNEGNPQVSEIGRTNGGVTGPNVNRENMNANRNEFSGGDNSDNKNQNRNRTTVQPSASFQESKGLLSGENFGDKTKNVPRNLERFDDSAQFGINNIGERHFRNDCKDERLGLRGDRPGFVRDEMRNFSRPDRRNFGNEDKFYAKDEMRSPFSRTGRDDRGFGRFGFQNDVNERLGLHWSGRRSVFDRFDRDERDGRGFVDRGSRGLGNPFERFGRGRDFGNELVWKPQVFDYSQGRPLKVNPDEGFKISTVVDYSHGENKQTFDYGHGESVRDRLEIKSFDYGHRTDVPTVIDYGHGVDKDIAIKDFQRDRIDLDFDMRLKNDCRRSRSPRGQFRSRSRSPLGRFRRNSISPSFKNQDKLRNRDGLGRQIHRRGRRGSEEKLSPGDDVSRHSFDVTTVLVEDLICLPGREIRPNKLVFIMRGLPGSGKTYVTKLIKDKEIELGKDPPRILSLDDYFMTEVEKERVDVETGRKVKTKFMEYEYEAAVEPHYKGSLVKAFKKTISDGFFSFVIVDSINEKTKDYEEMWSFAKQKGFQVYIAEMDNDVAVCTARNIHKRTEKEISDLAKAWEETPPHYLRLDVRSLLQSDAITEVEMEVVSDSDLEKAMAREEFNREKRTDWEEGEELINAMEDDEEDEPGVSTFVKSRWDQFENSEKNLDRLDGLRKRREGFHATMEDYLQLPDDFDQPVRDSDPGKKRVRWADLEERRQQEKMRAIGFVVGQTDWSRMTDPTFGESALTRTKYI